MGALLGICVGFGLCLSACDDDPGSEPVDGGAPLVDAGDALDAGDVAVGPVTGSWIRTFVNTRGSAPDPVDLSARVVGAWSEDAAGKWTHHPGKGTADGTLMVPGVPPGPFTLYVEDERGRRVYLDSPGDRALRLDGASIGRPKVLRSNDVATTLAVSIFDLLPWNDRHVIEIAFDTGTYSSFGFGPAPGSITHTEVLTDLLPLVDGPGKGDLLFVSQMVTEEVAPGIHVRTASVGAQVDSFTLNEFQANTLSVTMGPLPERVATFDFRQATFAAFADQVSPGAEVDGSVLSVTRVPDPATSPLLVRSLYVSFEDATVDRVITTSYRDVLPESWTEVGTATVYFRTSHPILGAGAPAVVTGTISISNLAGAMFAAPVVPLVTPPLAPTINGAPATQVQRGVGTTPVVAWKAPAIGIPAMYQVTIRELGPERDQVSWSLLATLFTAQTRLRVPGGILQEGGQYVLLIGAVVGDGVGATHPFTRGPVRALAETVTARIVP